MSDAIEALKALVAINDDYAPFGGEKYRDRVDRAWDAARAALTAYEAAKGGGVVTDVMAEAVDGKVVLLLTAEGEGLSAILDAEYATLLRGKLDAALSEVGEEDVALTSPTSGAGTREEIKGAVGRETEGWPAETDHVPSPASGERDAPQCCMCGKKGLSTTEGDGGAECELADGRWVCSQACYDKAVPMPGGERDAVKAVRTAFNALTYPVSTEIDPRGYSLRVNHDTNEFAAEVLAAALRMEGK